MLVLGVANANAVSRSMDRLSTRKSILTQRAGTSTESNYLAPLCTLVGSENRRRVCMQSPRGILGEGTTLISSGDSESRNCFDDFIAAAKALGFAVPIFGVEGSFFFHFFVW